MGRRGVSPVIAALLLIVIAVVGSLLVYFWVTGYFGEAAAGSKSEELRQALKIEGSKTEGDTLILYVRNIGLDKVTVDKVYVEKGGIIVAALDVEGGSVEIEPGDVGEVSVELPDTLQDGVYTLKVGSSSGVVASYRFISGAGGGGLSGWSYRREINITENSGSALINYQVKIVLTTANFNYSHASSDGSDIRFTDEDGTTQLSYWIEKWDPTGESIIWVKVPEIPAGGTKTIYLYYGNPSASSASDGDATFVFFDGFDGSGLDTSKWTTNTNNYEVSGDEIKLWGSWNENYLYLNTKSAFNAPVIVEARVKIHAVGQDTDLIISFAQTETSYILSTSTVECWYDGEGTGWWHQKMIVYRSFVHDYGPQIKSTDWEKIVITYTSNSIRYWDSYSGSTLADDRYMFDPFHLGIAGDTDSTTRYAHFDYIFIREYASSEPIVSIGPEESV